MAKNEENYNNSVLGYLDSIENDKLDRIAYAVTQFVKAYNRQILEEQKESSKKQTETIKVLKESEKSRKADAVQSAALAKQTAKNSELQAKTVEKILENSLDTKNAQETLQKIQESSAAAMKATNQEIIKGLSELSNLSAENVNYAEKLNNMTAEMQKDNAQARLQDMLKDTKRFRLESKYWKDLTGGIKGMAAEFHDFKNNPSRWMSEAMGNLLGKALDGSIEGLKETLNSGMKAITKGLGDLQSNLFNIMAEQKRQAEQLAETFNISYEKMAAAQAKSNVAIVDLMSSNELDISRMQKYREEIEQEMIRAFGYDNFMKMEKDVFKENFKRFAQAKIAGVDTKDLSRSIDLTTENGREIIELQTQMKGIYQSMPEHIRAAMEATELRLEDSHQAGRSSLQQAKLNNELQLTVAKMMASNSELMASDIEPIFKFMKELSDKSFVANLTGQQAAAVAQITGYDIDTTMKKFYGSEKGRLEIINKIFAHKDWENVPGIVSLLEQMNIDAHKMTGISQKQLKIDEESSQRIIEANNKNYNELNEALLSGGNLINAQLEARFRLLTSDGIVDDDLNIKDEGKIVVKEMQQLYSRELLDRKKIYDNLGESDEKKLENFNKIYTIADEIYANLKDTEEYQLADTVERKKMLFNEMKNRKEFKEADKETKMAMGQIAKNMGESEELIMDQVKLGKVMSQAQDLGFTSLSSGGGIQGLFTDIINAGAKAAYSPKYQEKLTAMLDNLGKIIKPAVNIFKKLLIDPILDVLSDKIALLLGEILNKLKFWETEQSEEEKFIAENKYRSRTVYDAETGEESSVDWTSYMAKKMLESKEKGSENFKKAINDLMNDPKADLKTVEKLAKLNKLDKNQTDMMKAYVALNKTSGISGILDSETSEIFASQREKIDTKQNITQSADAFNKTLNMLYGMETHSERRDFLDEEHNGQMLLDDEERKRFNKLFKELEPVMKKAQSGLSDFFKIKSSNFWAAIDAVAFELAKNPQLQAMIFNKKLEWHKAYDEPQIVDKTTQGQVMSQEEYLRQQAVGELYMANGGVVAATKGGKQITVGEAGHDEIIIPTDPAKQKRAQELLTLAQDKYGLYAKNPDNIDAKLKQQMADLLLDLRILMIQLNPMRDIIAMQKVMQAFSMLKNASVIANPDAATDAPEELIGEGIPTLGEPIKDAANLGSIRNAIIEEAKKYTGTPYAEAPAGLVCNELINAAYAGVLGRKNYSEMLKTLGYNHDVMHTISGFIPEIRKNSNDKVLLASSVEYSALSSLAKPGDLVFSANTGKNPSGLNPDNHGHVNLFIDKDSKIDSTSMKINGKDGVGVHKPGKGKHMLMNLLDNMPESWYVEKGLLKPDSSSERNIIGLNADGTPIYASNAKMSSYDPSLQSTPNASYVSDQVSRADQAKIEKERRIAERQNKTAMEQVTEVINNLGIKLTGMDMKRQISVNIPQDKTFCTSGMSSSSGTCYSVAR